MPKSATKPSPPKLSEVAQHVAVPAGVVSTGWPAVEAKCRDLGLTPRPWQPSVGKLILAKRADGKYAATIGGTGLSIPRQTGKTFLVAMIVFALCLLRPKLTVIWTAHRLRTAEETFKKMQAFARRKRIAPHIAKVTVGSGEGAIEFRNGSRILFGARERGFGRGFDEVDVLIFDEAQILTENALNDMVPATNQSRQDTSALMLFLGTPPQEKDPSEVFTRMRREALAGDADTGWVEFGSDPGYVFTELPADLTAADWKQIEKANPSYPEDTPREAILRMRKKLGSASFALEGAGQWPEDSTSGIPELAGWGALATQLEPPPPAALAVTADVDQIWLSLTAASVPVERLKGREAVERRHLGAVFRARADAGRSLFIEEVRRAQAAHDIPVAIDTKGPASFLIEALEDAGVALTPTGLDDQIQAQADLCEAVRLGTVEHGDYPELNLAVEVVGWRTVTDRRVFARKKGDVAMLEGAALALRTASQLVPTIY